jgi:hypothetical protein
MRTPPPSKISELAAHEPQVSEQPIDARAERADIRWWSLGAARRHTPMDLG